MKKCLTCDRDVSTVSGSTWCCVHCVRNGAHSTHCNKRNEMKKANDVHTEHCCKDHGCRYGHENDCPVMSGRKQQSFPCDVCDYVAKKTSWIAPVVRGFFGDTLQPVVVDALIDALVVKAKEVL